MSAKINCKKINHINIINQNLPINIGISQTNQSNSSFKYPCYFDDITTPDSNQPNHYLFTSKPHKSYSHLSTNKKHYHAPPQSTSPKQTHSKLKVHLKTLKKKTKKKQSKTIQTTHSPSNKQLVDQVTNPYLFNSILR